MKYATACTQCRVSKRRCDGDTVGRACLQCRRKNVECSFGRAHVPQFKPARIEPGCDPRLNAIEVPSWNIYSLLDDEQVDHLVRTYLDLIHDRPHSLFHIASLWNEVRLKTIHQPLLTGLCAFAARLSTRGELRERAHALKANAREALHSTMEDISVATVQACILLANMCAAELEPSLEALYFGIANRMAQILRLNQTDPSDSAVLAETKCRVWWALVMADNWCSTGLGIPRVLHLQSRNLPLPCDEYLFQTAEPDSNLLDRASPGIWAQMIRLVDLFGPICELNKCLASSGGYDDDNFARMLELATSLDEWNFELPETLRFGPANLDRHRRQGTGGCLVALHLGYHHYSSLLFFPWLDQDGVSPSSTIHQLMVKCRAHASAFSSILQTSRKYPDCSAVYATVGHMTIVSSSILLHTLLFGRREELDEARQSLIANFAALIELKVYWPCLEKTMGRLLLFQKSCLNVQSVSTYRVDGWMVKYLLEHSLPLDERSQPTSASPMSISSIVMVTSPHRMQAVDQALAYLWEV